MCVKGRVSERERESVCEREREREKEYACVCLRVCLCVRVCFYLMIQMEGACVDCISLDRNVRMCGLHPRLHPRLHIT